MRRGQPPVAGKPAAGYMTRTPPQPTAARRQRHLPTKYRPRRSTGRCAVAKASKQVDKPLGGRPSGQVAAVLAAGEYTVAAAARRRGTQPPTRLTAYRHRSAPPPLTTTAAANHRRRHQRDPPYQHLAIMLVEAAHPPPVCPYNCHRRSHHHNDRHGATVPRASAAAATAAAAAIARPHPRRHDGRCHRVAPPSPSAADCPTPPPNKCPPSPPPSHTTLHSNKKHFSCVSYREPSARQVNHLRSKCNSR